MSEQEQLELARGGDEGAFGRLVEPRRTELHAHCHRMLGSAHDAEDALQDTLLRAWRGLPRFAGRSSLRSWLYSIATNSCLDLIGRRPERMVSIDYWPAAEAHERAGEPLVEPVWVEPAARYEQRESVELAFAAALQQLPARQRAALILSEVLGFSAREVAQSMEASVASVNSALQRARRAVDERLPEQSQQATARSLVDQRLREVVDAYVDAWERDDIDAVAAMLTDDAPSTASEPRRPASRRARAPSCPARGSVRSAQGCGRGGSECA